MAVEIKVVYDQERGCGFRHRGLYLMGGEILRACGKLPVRIGTCPCCGAGIRVTRSLAKIQTKALFGDKFCDSDGCSSCIINTTDWGYLIGVGERHYRTPHEYLREVLEQGISKRIAQIPRDLEVGKSVIFLAHPKVFRDIAPEPAVDVSPDYEGEDHDTFFNLEDAHSETTGKLEVRDFPGVFSAFIPTEIQYVTDGTETEEQLERLVKRGITPVRIERVEDRQLELPENVN